MCGAAICAAKASGLSHDFDHGEDVRAELRLERPDTRRVDMRLVLDASLFRPNRRDVGAKRGQDLVAAPGLRGYYGDHTDHCILAAFARRQARLR